jgi:hypothetical protein
MRKDMSKVIVERPRKGRAWADLRAGRSRALVDDDGEPFKAKGAREPEKPQVKTKSLNETLNPLKRYLASNVGRPWNKVYSEISEHLKPSSTVQQHVRDHIEDFVAIKTRMKSGVVMVTQRYGGERPLDEVWSYFYVHPKTGILRKNDMRKTWSTRQRDARLAADKERAARMRVIDARTQLHKLRDDIWWEVKLGKIGDGREVDVVLSAGLSTLTPDDLYGRENTRAIAKRQLNKAEIKRLKLR